MRYLPEKFPIRYALIVSEWLDDDITDKEKLQFFTPARSEMLFRQFVSLLQKNPLIENLLKPSFQGVKFAYMDIEVMNIAKINPPIDWADKLEKLITQSMPEIKRVNTTRGAPFDVGLYSYQGASEMPSFLTAHNMLAKSKNSMQGIMEIVGNFGHIENTSSIKFLHGLYEKIRDNKITNYELYESMARYERPIFISAPYSKIWEVLDSGFNNGIVKLSTSFGKDNIIEASEMDEDEIFAKTNKISVAIFRKWEDVFAEEISSLYRIYTFCNNCGKALPFDYQGKYCPEIKENKACTKERARKRAKKVTSLRKNL